MSITRAEADKLRVGDIIHARVRVAKAGSGIMVVPEHWANYDCMKDAHFTKAHLVYTPNIVKIEEPPYEIGDLVTINASRHVWKIVGIEGDSLWVKTEGDSFATILRREITGRHGKA